MPSFGVLGPVEQSIEVSIQTPVIGAATDVTDDLLLEDGSFLLQETESKILLED